MLGSACRSCHCLNTTPIALPHKCAPRRSREHACLPQQPQLLTRARVPASPPAPPSAAAPCPARTHSRGGAGSHAPATVRAAARGFVARPLRRALRTHGRCEEEATDALTDARTVCAQAVELCYPVHQHATKRIQSAQLCCALAIVPAHHLPVRQVAARSKVQRWPRGAVRAAAPSPPLALLRGRQ